MARPVSGLSARDAKIIQSLQEGAKNKVAALDADVSPTSDIKKPVQRAKEKLRKARFSEAIRTRTKEDRGVIIMGERLYQRTPDLEVFTNISEPHLCFIEHLLSRGWKLDKDGTLFNPNDLEGFKE
ncbi:hypothetical protein [Aeromonas sp. HMWF014]|uniref:hypothetical protein n=1 Tax=Aeromonas sp. HMWF014 TaxID=2056850 RepID=UPI000D3A1624|nr:hypothetical protein [Aeromonas sp. HMWF014]PTT45190.1 hypothetical protein DBR19_20915 [Aeromonas sp. HMWF014]